MLSESQGKFLKADELFYECFCSNLHFHCSLNHIRYDTDSEAGWPF